MWSGVDWEHNDIFYTSEPHHLPCVNRRKESLKGKSVWELWVIDGTNWNNEKFIFKMKYGLNEGLQWLRIVL